MKIKNIILIILITIFKRLKFSVPQMQIRGILFTRYGICDLEEGLEIEIRFLCHNCLIDNLSTKENFNFLFESSNNVIINCTIKDIMNDSRTVHSTICFIQKTNNQKEIIIDRSVNIIYPDESIINKTINSIKSFNSCYPRFKVYKIYFNEEGYCLPLSSSSKFKALTLCENCNETNSFPKEDFINFHDASNNVIKCNFPFDIISNSKFNLSCYVQNTLTSVIIKFDELHNITYSGNRVTVSQDLIFEEEAQIESKIKEVGCSGYNVLYINNISFLNYCDNILPKYYQVNLNVSCVPCIPSVQSFKTNIELINGKNENVNITCNFPKISGKNYLIVKCFLNNNTYQPLTFPDQIFIQNYNSVIIDPNVTFISTKGNYGPYINNKITNKKQYISIGKKDKNNFTLIFKDNILKNESIITAVYNNIYIEIKDCDFNNNIIICFPKENDFKYFYKKKFQIYVTDGCNTIRDSGVIIEVNSSKFMENKRIILLLILYILI